MNNQLKALREKAKPLLEKFENLRDNKPKSEYVRPEFMGKSKWAIEKDEAQTAYSNIKTTHDNLKEKGVTDDHRTQAKQQIAKDDPTLHSEALKAQKDIEAHRAEQKKKHRKPQLNISTLILQKLKQWIRSNGNA